MLWVLLATQMNILDDVQEDVYGVTSELKPDSISYSIMQIRTKKRAARKMKGRLFFGKKNSWVSGTRRNSKLCYVKRPSVSY